MGLGIDTSNSGGSFLPRIQYDARAGRYSRIDRNQTAQGWETNQVDITGNFKAVFDMENIQVGWSVIKPGQAPDLRMVAIGEDRGPKPTPEHKNAFLIRVKLAKDCGGDVREWTSSAAVVINAISELHDQFTAANKGGELPVVVMKSAKPVVTGSGAKKSTNYSPVFEIVQWVKRPADLTAEPEVNDAPATAPAPAATGSKQVGPPPAKETVAADDFG